MRARVVRRPDGMEPGDAGTAIVEAGTRIGRGDECDLVLDDKLRLVSRQHAWLAPHGRDAVLVKCISASAAIDVAGVPLPPGGEQVVRDGDVLRLGGFEVRIEIESRLAPDPLPVLAPTNPAFDGAPARSPAPSSMPSPAATPHAAARPASRLDQWFDLDSLPEPVSVGSRAPVMATDVVPQTARADLPPPSPALPAEPAAARAFDASLARAMLRAEPDASAPAVPAGGVPPPSTAPGDLSAGEPDAETMQALKRAFLRGAGLEGEGAFRVDGRWMEHIGALLRASTDGTLALLHTRAVAKRNIRAENTQIVARENNPLKFAPDGAQALMLLLHLHSRRGFLEPVDAVRDAHRDLQVHQLAMMAGMRAAVFELVSRLGPEATDAAEGPAHGLAQTIPMLRDAQLWRRYKLGHERMLQNLDDLFEAAFGREFLKAYEAQAKIGSTASPVPPTAGGDAG